jgi:dUTP pyrophosphatase
MFFINSQILFTIDSQEKAYLSGYMQGVSTRFQNETLYIRYADTVHDILKMLSDQDNSEKDCKIDFIRPNLNLVTLSHFNSQYDKIDDIFQSSFIRGVFDNSDNVFDCESPKSVITSYNINFLQQIKDLTNVKSIIVAKEYYYSLEFLDYNALDFCNEIYKEKNTLFNKENYNNYLKLCTYTDDSLISFKYVKNVPEAISPFKERASDSGYDLTLISLKKQSGNVFFYDTGISVQPPYGFYFDLIGRSSISKSGYILANNMGVIDRSYTGSILVGLIKINPDMPDLVLPNRLVQIIPRQICHLQPLQVDSLDMSDRNSGGFGSTNK